MDAVTFAALGEPSRLDIVELLRRRPFPVGEIADALGLRQPQVSKHLRVLRDAGIVAVEQVGRRRIHRLRAEPFADMATWAGAFEEQWEDRLDALGAFLVDQEGEDP